MSIRSRLLRTFFRRRHEAEIDEEIAFHHFMKTRDGLEPRDVRLRFGNPAAIREEVRAAGILVWLESAAQDARYGLRLLRRSPGTSAAMLLSLIVGIGANAGIFSLVDAAVLRSLPVHDPGSLALVEWTAESWPDGLVSAHTGNTFGGRTGPVRASSIAPGLYRALASEQRAVESLMGFADATPASVVVGRQPAVQVNLQYVSANFFQGLGVALERGRPFLPGDDRPGREIVVVLSHRFWLTAFGGRDDVLGPAVRVNGRSATVVGVAPPGFFGIEVGEWMDLYAPLAARLALNPQGPREPMQAESDGYWWVRQIARWKPGVPADAALAQLTTVFRHLAVPDSATLDRQRLPALVATPGRRGFDPVGPEQSRALWILLLIVGLVLLIVCANVANLLLARAVARTRESAIRLSLGASPARLLRQHLIESALLAIVGGACGIWAGHALAVAIQSLMSTDAATSGFDLRIDARIVGYTAGVSLVTSLLFGLAPSMRAARAGVSDALKAGSRSLLGGHLRLPRALVVIQMALSLTVLVAAGLLGRTLTNLRLTDIGFARDNVLYASVNPWRAGLDAGQVGSYVERLRSELAQLPGVRHAATIGHRPLAGSSAAGPANIPGRPFGQDPGDLVMLNELGEGVLDALGISIVAGRGLAAGDLHEGANAILVDERFARRFFGGREVLGQRVGFGPGSNDQYEIVGVVTSSRYNSLRTDLRPTMYRPHRPAVRVGRDVHVVIRADVDAAALSDSIRRTAAAVNPDVPVTELITQTAVIDRFLRTERLLATASTAFGVVALALAGIGLAGLLAYAVARRTNEIGVRIALGAAPGDVRRIVLGDSLRLAGLGIVVGLVPAVALARLLRSTLYGIEPVDVPTSVASLSILMGCAMLAAWLPARRASRIEPTVALRQE